MKQILRTYHAGVIADGGRRWAEANGVPLSESYRRSFERLRFWVRQLHNSACVEVSIYVLSAENLQRSSVQLRAVYASLPALGESLLHVGIANLRIVGEVTALPLNAQRALVAFGSIPDARNSGPTVNLLVGYDAWTELRQSLSGGRTPSLRDLQVQSQVDFVIRTGGGHLLSGFLPMQSRYARLVVTRKLFNDVNPRDLTSLIKKGTGGQQLRGR